MTDRQPTSAETQEALTADGPAQHAERPGPDDPVTQLRGAQVDVDVRRTTRIVVVVSLAGLAALVVALFVVQVNRNSKIEALQAHGVPVQATVSKCVPVLSGSGSSVGGYVCTVRFDLRGVTHREVLQGSDHDLTGRTISALTEVDDPANVYPTGVVHATHRTWTGFILPVVLLIVLLGLTAVAARRVRPHRAHRPT